MLRLAPIAAVPLVLVPALGAVQGGFAPDAWVWSGTLAAWAAALGLVLEGTGRLRREGVWLAATTALVLWTLASTLWSAVPAQSILEVRRTLVYGAVVLALIVLARRHAAHVLLAATHVAVSALVVYALVRYLAGPRPFLEFEGRLLSEPLGYANAVGILAAMAVILSVGRAADVASPFVRAASGALVPLLVLALDLTGSDASWLALAIGLATAAALQPSRRSLARTAAALAPAAIVAGAVGHYSELTSPASARLSAAVVAVVALACSAAAGLMCPFLTRPPARTSRATRFEHRRLLIVVVASLVASVGAAAILFGRASEPRSSYYHVAWHEYVAHPLLGSGAGTFGRYWLQSGRVAQWGGALDAHSLYLETLAELGPIGLCLVLGVFLYPLRGVIGQRGLPAVPTAAGAVAAFLVHAGLDWDWELPAVVIAGLACCAVVAFAEHEAEETQREAPRAARAVAFAAALLAGAASIAGARSATVPSAAPFTNEAPQSGALFRHDSFPRDRYLPL